MIQQDEVTAENTKMFQSSSSAKKRKLIESSNPSFPKKFQRNDIGYQNHKFNPHNFKKHKFQKNEMHPHNFNKHKFKKNEKHAQNFNKHKFKKNEKHPHNFNKHNSKKNEKQKKEKTVLLENVPLNISMENIRGVFQQYGALEEIVCKYKDDNLGMNVTLWYHDMNSALRAKNAKRMLFGEQNGAKEDPVPQERGPESNQGQVENLNISPVQQKRESNKNKVHVGNLDSNPVQQESGLDNNTVVVGNLDIYATEKTLWRIFKRCGEFVNVIIPRDVKYPRVGQGFAFIIFKDSGDVNRALKLDGTLFSHRIITVTKFLNREPNNLPGDNSENRLTQDQGSNTLSDNNSQERLMIEQQDMNDNSETVSETVRNEEKVNDGKTDHETDSKDSENNAQIIQLITNAKLEEKRKKGEEDINVMKISSSEEDDSDDSSDEELVPLAERVENAEQQQKEKKAEAELEANMKSKLPAQTEKCTAKKIKLIPSIFKHFQ